MPEKHVLHYLDGRGLGEVPRLLLTLANVPFEDKRYTLQSIAEARKDLDLPFHEKVPVLVLPDGKKIPQSAAIVRYLARKYGFYGKSEYEMAMVDAVFEQNRDYMYGCIPLFMVVVGYVPGTQEDKEKQVEQALLPARDKHLPVFEELLKKSESGYLVGDSLTFADLAVAELAYFGTTKRENFLENFPEVKAFLDRIYNLPGLKEYIKNRKFTDF